MKFCMIGAALLAGVALTAPSDALAQAHHGEHEDTASAHTAMMPGVLGIPRAREGSGTSWLPGFSPMYALHATAGSWSLMLHGNAFLQYIDEGSNRGDEHLGSINWIMGMARRPLAGGEFTLRTMLSLEPLTVGECGYPDLLATGEFCDGEPLHDRQHPHDVWMELAAEYARALGDDVAFQLYGGLSAEPALGPVAYPHRPSALPNPFAPITHHWLDATHIAFGVATAGLFTRNWKLEGSLFNGREPDEERWDLDLGPLDSYSGRVWYANERWALQVSAGHLEEAEVHEAGGPREDVDRYTASATYHRPVGGAGYWATTAAWGRNAEAEASTDAFLVETNLDLAYRDLIFGRGEIVEKTGADLALDDHDLEHDVFTVGKLSVGYVRQFGRLGGFVPGLGASVSLSFIPDDLDPFYGTNTAFGWSIFASLRPGPMALHAEPEPAPHRGTSRHPGQP